MALAFAEVPDTQDEWGKTRRKVFDVTLDTSYPTGGTLITPANVALRNIHGARVIGGNNAAKALMYHTDVKTNPGNTGVNLICMFPSGGGAAAPTTVVSPAIATGATAVTSAAANGSTDLVPGSGAEVGATANLSALIVRIEFVGN